MADQNQPTVLLLGAAGQLGTELRQTLDVVGRVVPATRADLDLTDSRRLREVVRAVSPAAIVNAAAFTSVDGAESHSAEAFAVNALAPGVLAEEAARAGALLVHYSTDYVFDGTARAPYREEDPPNPLGVYAESKLAGERAVAAAGAAHLILRVSWVYGAHGRNFVRWILRAARTQWELPVVRDQTGVPTWGSRVAEGTATILTMLRDGPRITLSGDRMGLYHCVSRGEASRVEFVEAILALDPQPDEHVLERIVPVSSEEFYSPARRPAYSVLDSTRLATRFGVRIPEWRDDLTRAMARGITPLPPSEVR